ncbi:MAG: hypothetical protein BWY56_01944 [Acidobacteria bacterium ADurb.Bin340]|nr:MAG: hypothetical protein BWY56_01944 [Acidobacteria bacterium ADurb.Bin340]
MSFRRFLNTAVVMALVVSARFLAAQVAVEVTPSDNGKVLVRVSNTKLKKVSFLRYNTPLHGMEANLFRILRDGQPVKYIGKLALRVGPTEQDWVTLLPNESITAEVDLSEHYALDRAGDYSVQFRYPVAVRDEESTGLRSAEDAVETPEVESDVVNVWVGEVRSVVPPVETRATRGFSGCTITQQNSINAAYSVSRTMAARAHNALANNSTYQTWFGAYTTTRANTVKSNYRGIYYAHNGNWNSTCTTCESGVIAYVYPSRPYNVWVCSYFHQFGATEKGSFLLHEASHWNAAAGTDDYGYGTTFCRNLARTNPGNAIWNADNYRYYALATY